MEYNIVALQEKIVAGISVRTSNGAPDMQAKIGGLWQNFYGKGIERSVTGRVNGRAIGLYTNYESDCTGEYDIAACCEVALGTELPEALEHFVIPGGKYAEFVVHGGVAEVGMAWGEIWSIPLNRAYTGDFEEYYESADPMNAEIRLYIALKD